MKTTQIMQHNLDGVCEAMGESNDEVVEKIKIVIRDRPEEGQLSELLEALILIADSPEELAIMVYKVAKALARNHDESPGGSITELIMLSALLGGLGEEHI